MKIKRLVNCFIPVSVCNFECRYCYIPQCKDRKKNLMPVWRLKPHQIAQALSQKRLGGPCFMNLCGDGETLIPKEVPEIIKELLMEGHYLEVVTNGTLTKRFEEIVTFDHTLLKHLEFKFSYHYEQLLNKGLLKVFWDNVLRVKAAGCSFTIELTPHDELIPYIEDIKKDCLNHVGAFCHITTAFNYQKDFSLLTKLDKNTYRKIWSQFESPMFDFKMSVLGEKRKEYCYAGEYLFSVDIASGLAHQCYCGRTQNIFDDLNRDIKWNAIGKKCPYPMCFNAHALMVFGAIPEKAKNITYSSIRNRTCTDGTEWLSEEIKDAFNSKFIETNKKYSLLKKVTNRFDLILQRIFSKRKR